MTGALQRRSVATGSSLRGGSWNLGPWFARVEPVQGRPVVPQRERRVPARDWRLAVRLFTASPYNCGFLPTRRGFDFWDRPDELGGVRLVIRGSR